MSDVSAWAHHQALVFGASGVSGWAIAKECLSYPSPDAFSRVIGLTNRPLSKEIAQFPDDSRLELYSDMNLSDRDHFEKKLSEIPDIDHMTHVYFTAYTGHTTDFQALKRANVSIFETALLVVKKLCPKVQYWTLQTGGKAYGVEFYDKVPYNPPLKETLPRIPEPYADNVFYYAQRDLLEKYAEGTSWSFCEIRPDVIVGFVPQGNAMGAAQAFGVFLSLYRHVEGDGAVVKFPGSLDAYTALHTDTSQDLLAKFHIYASLNPQKTSKRAFNVADELVTWLDVWPKLCAYFGLKGVGPQEDGRVTGVEWMEGHKEEARKWMEECGLREDAVESSTWEFLKGIVGIPFNREYDLHAIREVGFKDTMNHVDGYITAFDRMKKANIIA